MNNVNKQNTVWAQSRKICFVNPITKCSCSAVMHQLVALISYVYIRYSMLNSLNENIIFLYYEERITSHLKISNKLESLLATSKSTKSTISKLIGIRKVICCCFYCAELEFQCYWPFHNIFILMKVTSEQTMIMN